MSVIENNNEEETVPEVPNLEMLIEDDSKRGENEVIENEVIDEIPIDEEVSIDAGFEVPRVMNKSAKEEIVPEVPKLEMLIEDDSERGENEVIENEVIDEAPIDEEVSIDAGFELPKIMNESAEEEIVIEKDHLKDKMKLLIMKLLR